MATSMFSRRSGRVERDCRLQTQSFPPASRPWSAWTRASWFFATGPLFHRHYSGIASYIDPRAMPNAPTLPEHVFDRIPVVLLGGVNLVRALGLAGIPAIVASPKEDEP